MSLVAVRADASRDTGAGHIKRCLALAHALTRCGFEVVFVSRRLDGVAAALLDAEPFQVRWLEQGGDALEELEDARRSIDVFGSLRPDWLIVDSYRLGAGWHRAVRWGLDTRVVAIDDLGDRPLQPDVLVDPNLHADHVAKFRASLVEPAVMLCGTRFALLDPVYGNSVKHKVHDVVRSIGIFMGGTDAAGTSLMAVRACIEGAGFGGPVEVVSPLVSPHHEALKTLARERPQVEVTPGLPHLADFFARHDLQIGAGGGAVWERCCMGVPTIAVDIAANQLATLPALEAAGAVCWVRGRPNPASGLALAVRSLLDDPEKRRAMTRAARELVDGRGAPRVAAVLACAGGAGLRARPARLDDEDLLLVWANDPVVRQNAFHTGVITPEAHHQWFTSRLADPARHRLLVLEAPNGIPAGQVRLHRLADGAWEVGYLLDPAFRGLGLGHRLLGAALAHAGLEDRVVARVKPGNPASSKVFRRLGFHESAAEDERGRHQLFTLPGTQQQPAAQ